MMNEESFSGGGRFLLAEGAVAQLQALELVVFGVKEAMTGVALSDADVGDEIAVPAPS